MEKEGEREREKEEEREGGGRSDVCLCEWRGDDDVIKMCSYNCPHKWNALMNE